MRLTYIFVFWAAAIAVAGVQAAPARWSELGPEGGAIAKVLFDPVQANWAYAASAGGVYVSTDGGLRWGSRNAGFSGRLQPQTLQTHASSAGKLLVASGNRLFHSQDAGQSWQPLQTGLGPDGWITALGWAESDATRMYVAGFAPFKLLVSDDAGQTWVDRSAGLTGDDAWTMAVDPTDAEHVLLSVRATANGVPAPALLESTDAGQTWVDISAPIAQVITFSSPISDIIFSPDGKWLLATYNQLLVSSNQGASYTALPVSGDRIAVNPANVDEWVVSGNYGVHHTQDAGQNWSRVLEGFTNAAGKVVESTRGAFSLSGDALLMGSRFDGIFHVSTVSGLVFGQRPQIVRSLDIRALAMHPTNPSRLYVGTGNSYTSTSPWFQTLDAGQTWTGNNTPLPANQLRDIAVDPGTPATAVGPIIYAVGSHFPGDLDTAGNSINGDSGVYKSLDGGGTWLMLDQGLPYSNPTIGLSALSIVRDVLVIPDANGGEAQRIFIAASGKIDKDATGNLIKTAARIYRSDDAGATWVASDTGMDLGQLDSSGWVVQPAGIRLLADPGNSSIMYAITYLRFAGYAQDTLVIGNGVWKSVDGGLTWAQSSNGLPKVAGPGSSVKDVAAIAMDPGNSQKLYVSVIIDSSAGSYASEIYRSDDGGASWVWASNGLLNAEIFDVQVDSNGVVYAAFRGSPGNPGGVFYSEDGGNQWHSLSLGLSPAVDLWRLLLDESGTYLKLYGGSSRGVLQFERVPDADRDGVPDLDESAVSTGDANGDGQPDAQQANVATLAVDTLLKRSGSKATQPTITVEVDSLQGNCSGLENVGTLQATEVAPMPGVEFPHGTVSFEVVGCQQAQVSLTFHAGGNYGPGWRMRALIPDVPGSGEPRWQTFAPASVSGNRWTFVLTDGQYGDVRPANGRILFQGGVGYQERVFTDAFE